MANIITYSINRYKEAYSGHPREIWTLALVTLINRMGTMVIPFLSVYLTTDQGFKLETAGLIASAFGFGSMAGSFLGGKLSDRWGAVQVIRLSLLLGGVGFFCLQFFHEVYGLWPVLFLTTVFGEAYRPAYSVAVGSLVPKEKMGRTMSLLRLAVNLGMSLAPALGGFVIVSFGYQYLFWIEGFTCIAAAILFSYWSRNWKIAAKKAPESSKKMNSSLSPLKDKKYLLFLLVSFLISFIFLQWFHTVPVFIKKVWKFNEGYIGILMGISSALVALIEMPIIDTIEKQNRTITAMRLGLIFIFSSYLLFFLPGATYLGIIAIVIWTLGEIFFLPLNNSLGLQMSPEENRGDFMAWYYMTWSLSNVLAPTLGLGLIAIAGYQVFWAAIVGLGLIALLVYNRLSMDQA
ncbi:MAG: MFS transporter [Bacteroidia bacterium]|nr:MFS transporter [Bacteroidia bacterium]